MPDGRITITEDDLAGDSGAPGAAPAAPTSRLPAVSPPAPPIRLDDEFSVSVQPAHPAAYPATAVHPLATTPLAPPPAPPRPPRRWPWYAAGGASLAIVAIVLAVVLLNRGDARAEYRTAMQGAMRPVADANPQLATALRALDGPGSSEARASVSAARASTDDARAALARIEAPEAAAGDLRAARQTLTREAAYLAAIDAVLRDPTSDQREQVAGAEQALQSSLSDISPPSQDWGEDVGGAAELSSWARARSRARQRSAAAAARRRRAEEAEQAANVAAAAAAATQSSQPSDCGEGVTAGPNTTCEFAFDVRDAWRAVPGMTASVDVYDRRRGRSLSMYCTPVGGGMRCTSGSVTVSF